MRTTIKLNIDPEQLLEELNEYVDTKNKFVNNWSNTITKPFYGTIEDDGFIIKNTPALFRDSIVKIKGRVQKGEIDYSVNLNNKLLMTTLIIIMSIMSILFLTIGPTYIGFIGIGIIILFTFILGKSILYKTARFKKIILEIDKNGAEQ